MTRLDSTLLAVNLIALGLVVYQSVLTRQALKVTDESLKITRRAVHLEMLPRGTVLVHVAVLLERFQRVLTQQIALIERARLGELNALEEAASKGEPEARGLILKPMYDACPEWLQVIYGSGVQHYYQANGPFVRSLWDTELGTPRYGAAQDYGAETALDNLREGHAHVANLLEMLRDLLPDVWLNTPASMSDDEFFDR